MWTHLRLVFVSILFALALEYVPDFWHVFCEQKRVLKAARMAAGILYEPFGARFGADGLELWQQRVLGDLGLDGPKADLTVHLGGDSTRGRLPVGHMGDATLRGGAKGLSHGSLAVGVGCCTAVYRVLCCHFCQGWGTGCSVLGSRGGERAPVRVWRIHD